MVPRAHLCLLALLALLAGCVTEPELQEPTSATTGVRGMLATDLSRASFARRTNAVGDNTLALFSSEFRRPLTANWSHVVEAPEHRLTGMARTAGELSGLATRSRMRHAEDLARELSVSHAAHDLGETMASLPIFLGTDRRPMGEIDDKRHRTDPFDDSPEASLVDRLRRRLRL